MVSRLKKPTLERPPRPPFPHPPQIARGQGSRGSSTVFFSLALLGYSLLTLPVSAPIWRLITPLALVQFPWRMLGPAALCAAVLIGLSTAQVAAWLKARGAAPWLGAAPLVAVVGVIYFGNLGWWYPRFCASAPTANVADLVQFEIDSHTVGTTAKGEYIPLTAPGVPDNLSLADALRQGQEPSRLSLPAGATVTTASVADPLNARYELTTSQPVTATYRQFYYPGWQVRLDGQALPAAPDASTGLIVFPVPSGAHQVQVSFGSTPLRTAAGLVSLMAVLGVAAWALAGYGGRRQKAAPASPEVLPDQANAGSPRPLSRWDRGAQ